MELSIIWLLQGSGKWYELQDLHVADILPQMITLSESYIQVHQIHVNLVQAPQGEAANFFLNN